VVIQMIKNKAIPYTLSFIPIVASGKAYFIKFLKKLLLKKM